MKLLSQEEITFLKTTMIPIERKNWIQNDILAEWRKNHCIGTLEAATGVGKTRPAVLAIVNEFAVNPNAIVYILVPTETLRDTGWPDEFKKWGATHLLPKVKIICHASMDKEIVQGDIDLEIFDEVHHATPQNSSFFNRNKCYKKLHLTATAPKTGGYEDEKAKLVQQLAPTFYKIPVETAIELELVADFEVMVLKIPLDDKEFYIPGGTAKKPLLLTEAMEYNRLTKRIQQCMFNPHLAGAKFARIQQRTMFIRNLKTKTLLAKEVMASIMQNNERTLIFAGSIDQSGILCDGNVYNSTTTNAKLTAFKNKEISYLGAVDALNKPLLSINLFN